MEKVIIYTQNLAKYLSTLISGSESGYSKESTKDFLILCAYDLPQQ